jgi:ABC-type uncharacterized transport system ATPase subunit
MLLTLHCAYLVRSWAIYILQDESPQEIGLDVNLQACIRNYITQFRATRVG